MRRFFIFNIKEEYAVLTKNNPYHLFKMFYYISNLNENELSNGILLFNKLTLPFNMKRIDIDIFKKYQDNYFYTKFKNIHKINNIFKNEESTLIVHKYFLELRSTVVEPSFLKDLVNQKNLFFCDFKNKDYFWLDNLYTWT